LSFIEYNCAMCCNPFVFKLPKNNFNYLAAVEAFLFSIPHRTAEQDEIIEAKRRVLHFQSDEIYNPNAFNKAIAAANIKRTPFIQCNLQSPIKIEIPNDIYSLDYSLNKRNRDPPLMNVVHDSKDVQNIVDRFFYVFVDKQKLEEAKSIKVLPTTADVYEWLYSRNDRVKGIIENMLGIKTVDYLIDANLVNYDVHMKVKVKPKLDGSHLFEEPAAQIITAMDNELSVAFTPFIKLVDFYLKYALKSQFLINDGINIKHLDCFINTICSKGDHQFLETDFSKFDKSQESLALEIQCEIFRRFGLHQDFIKLWYKAHLVNKLKSRKFGVKITTHYQRRSGDVFTFLGNTIVLMAALAYSYPLENYYGGVFGGDDSLIVVNDKVDISNDTNMFAERFNYYVKLEPTQHSVCFASKFLIRNYFGMYYFVPDPVKMLLKICRNDLTCYNHLQEFRRNYYLMVKLFVNSDLDILVDQVCARYHKMNFRRDLLMRAILGLEILLSSDRKFSKLYKIPVKAYIYRLAPSLREKLLKARRFYEV